MVPHVETDVMSALPRVLVVDDDEIHREVIRRLLGDGFELIDAETGNEALDVLASVDIDCVLLDYRLPDYTGLELLPDMTALDLPVVMFTALVTDEMQQQALIGGALGYMQKDQLTAESLAKSVTAALEHSPRRARAPA